MLHLCSQPSAGITLSSQLNQMQSLHIAPQGAPNLHSPTAPLCPISVLLSRHPPHHSPHSATPASFPSQEYAKTFSSRGLCLCCSLCLDCCLPDDRTAQSLTLFRSLLKFHLLKESFQLMLPETAPASLVTLWPLSFIIDRNIFA